MYQSNAGTSLFTSLQRVAANWQGALRHFHRSVVECGSPLEIEHAQRLGLLFSKGVGRTPELHKWASLFYAEDIPACALMLKALVFHDQWKTAISIFEWSIGSPDHGELGEHLAQFLVSRGYSKESFVVARQLASSSNSPPVGAVCTKQSTDSSLVQKALDDSLSMSTCAHFIPTEERVCYCGLGSSVFRAFPKNAQWREACDTLDRISFFVGLETRLKLMEYRAAKSAHGGRQYAGTLRWLVKEPLLKSSPSLLRTLLHCSLKLNDLQLAMICLESLTSIGSASIPLSCFEDFCDQFLNSANSSLEGDIRRFVHIVSVNASIIVRHCVRQRVALFFANKVSEPYPSLFHNRFPLKEVLNNAAKFSITELDNTASLLLHQNRWKEALSVLEIMCSIPPLSDGEKMLQGTVTANLCDWEQALLIFS